MAGSNHRKNVIEQLCYLLSFYKAAPILIVNYTKDTVVVRWLAVNVVKCNRTTMLLTFVLEGGSLSIVNKTIETVVIGWLAVIYAKCNKTTMLLTSVL